MSTDKKLANQGKDTTKKASGQFSRTKSTDGKTDSKTGGAKK